MSPFAGFIAAHTVTSCAVLVPEIQLALARDATGIFEAAATLEPDGTVARSSEHFPPYWAFAWPGGQATARYILDNPALVRGRRVLDIGAGSGIAAIAAAKAGATHVLGADVDPCAALAIAHNTAANGVTVHTTMADILGEPPDADVILIGDLVYEPELATRVAALLQAAQKQGATVLIADRQNARHPPVPLDHLADYAAPLMPPLPAHPFETASLWRLAPVRRRPRPSETKTQRAPA